jgi:hypothetical protein
MQLLTGTGLDQHWREINNCLWFGISCPFFSFLQLVSYESLRKGSSIFPALHIVMKTINRNAFALV